MVGHEPATLQLAL